MSYSTKFGYRFLKNKEKKDRILEVQHKIQPMISNKNLILNPAKVHFRIMNPVAKLVVAWHFVHHACMGKCNQRSTSTSADIQINYSSTEEFLRCLPDLSAQSMRLKRYHGQMLPWCYISQHLTRLVIDLIDINKTVSKINHNILLAHK